MEITSKGQYFLELSEKYPDATFEELKKMVDAVFGSKGGTANGNMEEKEKARSNLG